VKKKIAPSLREKADNPGQATRKKKEGGPVFGKKRGEKITTRKKKGFPPPVGKKKGPCSYRKKWGKGVASGKKKSSRAEGGGGRSSTTFEGKPTLLREKKKKKVYRKRLEDLEGGKKKKKRFYYPPRQREKKGERRFFGNHRGKGEKNGYRRIRRRPIGRAEKKKSEMEKVQIVRG